MRDEFSRFVVAVLGTTLAMIGLFMWAHALDTGIAVFGCSLLVFGMLLDIWLLKSWCDASQPRWAKESGR
jgi:hypothetical protein